MKSPRKLRSLLLWLLASVVMTITFRMASTRTPNHHQPLNDSMYLSRMESQPSGHLVEAALRKVDFPQMLDASEQVALHQPILTPSGTLFPDHSLFVEAISVVADPNLTWDPCLAAMNGGTGNGGNQTGAWTFNELMTSIAGPGATTAQAEQMLTNMLYNFATPVTIGSFTAITRPMGPTFYSTWPVDPNGLQCIDPSDPQHQRQITCKSLANAPVHLNAIVNRVDIGQNGQSGNAGQLRFVFGVTMDPANDDPNHDFCENPTNRPGSGNQNFNIILEYDVPSSITAQSWASQWANLSTLCKPTITASCAQNTFDPALLAITSQVTNAGAGGLNAPNGSALNGVRTNEVELDPNSIIWEMRQFQLGQPSNPTQLIQTALNLTPDLSFDGADNQAFCELSNQNPRCNSPLSALQAMVQLNQDQIIHGTFTVHANQQAASALNLTVWWDSLPSMASNLNLYQARAIFAASPRVANSKTPGADPRGGIEGTCNGCHGLETQTSFRQVINRASGTGNDQPSVLSGFLVGCNNGGAPLTGACGPLFPLNSSQTEVVQDPVYGSGFNNTFGDVQRRLTCMNTILNNPGNVCCDGAGNLCSN